MSAFDYLPDASAAVICAPIKAPAYSAHHVATGKHPKGALHPVIRGGIGGSAQKLSFERTAPVTWWYEPTSYRQAAARGLDLWVNKPKQTEKPRRVFSYDPMKIKPGRVITGGGLGGGWPPVSKLLTSLLKGR